MLLIILKCAKSMTLSAQLPDYLWTGAIGTTTLLMNLRPSMSNNGLPPLLLCTCKPTDVSKLKVFGCTTEAHIKKVECNENWSPASKLCMFLGYESKTKNNVLHDSGKKKISVCRDVKFNKQEVAMVRLKPRGCHLSHTITYALNLP